MKHFLLLITLLTAFLSADNNETEELVPSSESIVVEDTSGLSEIEIRKIANKADDAKKEVVTISEVINATDINGSVDIEKLQLAWEELSPTPKKYDWIKTKSGEWFKGEIKAMYNKVLEFDSDEIGIHSFDFEDISEIKSFYIMGARIDNVAEFVGILRFKNDKLTVIQGDNSYEFKREDIVSFAKSGDREFNFWSGKITLNIDARYGNKDQYDFTAQGKIERRTSNSRLRLDYIGRVSEVEETLIANNHRINEKYDVYLSRYFFWTPIFSEFYQDDFQNIEQQYTFGVGLGYTIIDSKKLEWDVSGGPAYKLTKYYTVAQDGDKYPKSPSIEIGTKVQYELTKTKDVTFDAKLTFTDDASGAYKHHIILILENELLSWLDLDITAIWDRTQKPEKDADGVVPNLDDYQMLIGLGVEF